MKNNTTLTNCLIALLVTIFLALGELWFTGNETIKPVFHEYIKTYSIILLFLVFLYISRQKILGIFLLTLIVLGTGINTVFHSYFGRYLMPYDISMFFYEVQDTTEGFIGGIDLFYKPLIYFAFLYAFSIFFLLYKNTNNRKIRIIASVLIYISTLALFIPVMKGKNFEVNLHNNIIRNSINLYTNYIGNLFKKDKATHPNYQPYVLTKNHAQKVNVIFIMGESENFSHMSLYGYSRKTTPFLDSLAIQEPNHFKYYYGVSRGFSTRISVPLTLNVIQEPDNVKQLLSLDTNLFHMAKKNGYMTYYFSNQKSGVLASLVNSKDINYFYDAESNALPKNTITDMRLLELMDIYAKNQKFQDKPFFLVLHQRNHHYVYKDNYLDKYDIYKGGQTEHERMINTYDNSMRFQDDFMKALIQRVEKITNKPTLIVYASDHGELFGKDGLWGHGAPDINTAGIPIWIYATHGAESLLKNNSYLPKDRVISSYQIGKFVASSIGWNIKNPNEVKDFYVNITLPFDNLKGYRKYSLAEAENNFF